MASATHQGPVQYLFYKIRAIKLGDMIRCILPSEVDLIVLAIVASNTVDLAGAVALRAYTLIVQ